MKIVTDTFLAASGVAALAGFAAIAFGVASIGLAIL